MRLTELEPRWISANVFVFKCPHCKTQLLTCKTVIMPMHDQCELFEKEFGEDWDVVPAKPDMAWQISSRNFATMSVIPSLDASDSGHWHGVIADGEVRP